MGSAAEWSAELASAGRVVFRPRRNRLLIRLAGVSILMVSSLWSNIDRWLDGEATGVMGVLRVTALLAFVYAVGLTCWQLATRRPEVVVDAHKIQVGRRTLGWHQAGRVSGPAGLPTLRTVTVFPARPQTDRVLPVSIGQDHVREQAELADWLRSVLAGQVAESRPDAAQSADEVRPDEPQPGESRPDAD